ncbi:hypothetical protein [Edaphobacter modestus]|uniref:Uncharacterized protein n=1 Tax=Edaphobacter modestus TaxID=388466 RepID=A0A4Q7YQX0_9BACT|nr:hypothetical protein [Edaphobacter modestus]RZU39311.1 hypothetical protein BDD14_0680 [Edaphobacter modestus]
MATKRKPPKKAEPIDVSARLAEALAEKPKAEGQTHQDAPVVGDIVTVGTGKSELRITKVYDNGQAVDLELPGTNLERFRVRVEDLNFVERQPRKPKEPEKPKIDVEEVREHIAAVHHSIIDHINGEIAILKKYLKSKGVSAAAANALDEFSKATESGWKEATATINETLAED